MGGGKPNSDIVPKFSCYDASSKPYVYIAATEEIMIEKEVTGYTGLSLFADMGGSLGMFLGFSFLGAWDTAEPLLLWVIQAWEQRIVVD